MAEPKDTTKGVGSGRGRTRKRNEDLSNFVFGKVQPQAVPLEEAILGALMLDKEALAVVLDILRSESFYLEAHQLIYKAMLRLFERSQPIDLLTVAEELKKSGDLAAVGGPAYISELTMKVASAANIEYHARIISQKYIQRELITVSTKIIRDAFEDTTDVFQLLDDAEQGLFDIAQQNMSRGFDSMGSLASKALKQMEELKNKEDGLTGVPSGFTELDRLTSGWQPSDLIILAARPGMGKCLGKGTKVLMYDGQLKKVEDIQVGELLMGDDSTPRTVLSLARGRERMYWIRQQHGIDYRVNESHILSLKQATAAEAGSNEVIDIAVKDYVQQADASSLNGYKVPITFEETATAISPYWMGLKLTNAHSKTTSTPLAFAMASASSAGAGTDFRQRARLIPQVYLANSAGKRWELLAGLLDGAQGKAQSTTQYEAIFVQIDLSRQAKWLADSLGLRTSLIDNRLLLEGNLWEIPFRIKPAFAKQSVAPAAWQQTDFTIEEDDIDDYYGFEIDGNRRFLLEDMTVTHNTSFVLSVAKNAALDFNKPVAVFSLEMSSLQLAQRIISIEAEIEGSKMRNGQLEEYEWQQLHSAIERVSEVPIYIDDTPGINVFELRAKCRRLKMQHDIQMVIIDYLQLMTGGGENSKGNREQEISAISRALKGLAKELQVPVIALSQLSRAVEMRGGTKRPQLSDLRESGAIEQDADMVSFIYRPEYYQILEDEEGQSLKGVAEIIIAKNRHGALKTIKLRFTSQFARFSDLDDPNFDDLPTDAIEGPYQNIITRPSKMNSDEDIPF